MLLRFAGYAVATCCFVSGNLSAIAQLSDGETDAGGASAEHRVCCKYDREKSQNTDGQVDMFLYFVAGELVPLPPEANTVLYSFRGRGIEDSDLVGAQTLRWFADGGISARVHLHTRTIEEYTADIHGMSGERWEILNHSNRGRCLGGADCKTKLDHQPWAEVRVEMEFKIRSTAVLTDSEGVSNASVWMSAYSRLAVAGMGCNTADAKKIKVKAKDDEQPSYEVSESIGFAGPLPTGDIGNGQSIPGGPWHPSDNDFDYVSVLTICKIQSSLECKATNRAEGRVDLNDYEAFLEADVLHEKWSVKILSECHDEH